MCFFFQAEDGIRDLVRSRGLGDVYKRQRCTLPKAKNMASYRRWLPALALLVLSLTWGYTWVCLLYTSDAADERSSVDLGGRRIIKKKKKRERG